MSDKRQLLIQEVLESLAVVKGSFRHGHGPMFKKHGFSVPGLRLMMNMADSEDGVSVSELSKLMDITPAAVTQFVDKLVDKGLVERFEDPVDRRIVRIKLAPKAQKKFGTIKRYYFDRMTSLFRNLTDQELEQLASILKKIEADPDESEEPGHWQKWHEIKKDIK